MDNILLLRCVIRDKDLSHVFAGFLLEDDVQYILGGSKGQMAEGAHSL